MMKRVRAFLAGMAMAGFGLLAPGLAISQGIETSASHAVIYDADTGEVLWSKGGTELMVPASMTKIMTAYVVFDRIENGELRLTDEFTTSERAWREGGWASGGSTMGLEVGQRATVDDLLHGMIVVSGNDACIVLAEGISVSEEAFAEEMTRVARRLGFDSATFENSTGLYGENHRISPVDLARLTGSLIDRFPQFYDYYAIREYRWNDINQPNRNRLLDTFPGADGVKTGHLSQSGYGMVASAVQDGRRIIVVVNGLPSEAARAQETERLMRLGFTAFETRDVGEPGKVIAELDVALGTRPRVGVALQESVRISAAKRAFREGTTEVVWQAPLQAPVRAGDKVAELIISIPDKEPVHAPLYAVADVDSTGFLQKALDGLSFTLFGAP